MSKNLPELIEGYKIFREHYFNSDNTLYERLNENGQTPKALIIACSDSRVDPAIILNAEPGDLFVVRNVANLVPPYEADGGYHGTSAALEFAVCNLQVEHIIIFGHTICGGIQALLQSTHLTDTCTSFIRPWMKLAQKAAFKAHIDHEKETFDQKVTHCCRYAIMHSLENLMSFPFINERVNSKKIQLHGWQFDIASGVIKAFNKKSNIFEDLDVSMYI